MPLPKIKYPVFELTIPSTKETKTFRPYLGAEEKILLIAKESGEPKDIIMSLKQVIQNCCQDEDFDANTLATFDIEYLFLKLRARSVDNVVQVSYMDPEDEETYKFNVDLNEVEMFQPGAVSNTIEISETDGIIMRYPSIKIIQDMPEFENGLEELTYLIRGCVVSLYDEETVYPMTDISDEEFNEYLDNLPVPVLNQIKEFLQAMPRMYYEMSYTNKLGTEKKIILRSLSDFFILG